MQPIAGGVFSPTVPRQWPGLLDFRMEQREVHRGERGRTVTSWGAGGRGGKPRGGWSSVHTVRRARTRRVYDTVCPQGDLGISGKSVSAVWNQDARDP